MTLGVLAPYRGVGIGSVLLQRSLEVLQELPEVVEAYLHVQVRCLVFFPKRLCLLPAAALPVSHPHGMSHRDAAGLGRTCSAACKPPGGDATPVL